MRILVLHGFSGNFGDSAMLEGVVCNLLRNLPAAELFVADRPGLRTNIWNLPRVQRQTIPAVQLPYEDLVAELPYFWRYRERCRKVSRWWLSLALGSTRRAKEIRLSGVTAGDGTTEQFCAPFDALHMVGW